MNPFETGVANYKIPWLIPLPAIHGVRGIPFILPVIPLPAIHGVRGIPFILSVISLFLAAGLCIPASGAERSEIDGILRIIREVADGRPVSGGVRPALSPALVQNPRLALPDLDDTNFVRRIGWYAPFAGSPEDHAAVALGLWIAENAETIALSPRRRESAGSRISLVWPGSLLFLERTPDGLRIAGAAETAPIASLATSTLRPSQRRLTIIFTNDIHGYLLPYPAPWSKSETRPILGAMGSVATYVRRSRAVAAALDDPLFLFDAGDLYQGTPEGTLTKGSVMIPVMNALRYDAIVVGNHEYDHGRKNAERLLAGLRAPVLGANVFDTSTGKLERGLRKSLVLERGGVRLGLTGLLTTKMPTLTFEKNIRGLEFRPQIPVLAEILPELRAENPNLVVLLSHTGFLDDQALADSVPGIDIIVGGHSHTPVDTAWVGRNGTIVVQTPGKASDIGRLDVLVSADGGLDSFVWQSVTLYLKSFPTDPRMQGIIRQATERMSAEMARVIGHSETNIPHSYRQESPMGRLATDILRSWAGADIAILSGGGTRAGFIPGPIEVRHCFQVFPFGNPLAMAAVPGDAVSRVLEHGASTDRGRIQVSGVTILADTTLPPGQRLIEIRVGDALLDPNRTYRIVTDGFLAQGGSGYFSGEKILWDINTDQTPFELLRDHVARAGTVRPPPVERIRYK
ncbi:bifunctional metallophosphatase/5'-nucleotidase [bacterium]|nr:bifunctional metallophosphatase/5'-nucleotidase [bacterium]